MTTAHAVDIGFLVVAAVGPVLFVLRWRRRGVAPGAIFAWGVLVVAGEVLSALDPARMRMLDHLWFFFGWIGTLSYALAVYLVVSGGAMLWSSWQGFRTRRRSGSTLPRA